MNSSDVPPDGAMFLIEESKEERMSRVEDLRRSVASGSYVVPANAVADAVVAFFSRSFGPVGAPNPVSPEDSC
ncbi:MAG: flagellar biosynthesis anti-sigma factor FlgM [Acidimicrobiia bacterium]|nr:flagellar biosynthesis anti-sigma factor FlgM [Acidimicrobiia bacterium]